MDALSRYLEEAAARPPDWGVLDCMLFPADWVLLATGHDPAAGWRGRYRTELGAAQLIRRGGGLPAMTRQAMTRWPATTAAERGDVGLIRIETPTGPTECGGICAGRAWSAIYVGGLYVGPAEPLAAWSIGGRH